MKKIIFFNLLFCFLVIIICSYSFDFKSKKAVAYYHAQTYIETNYEISSENLNSVEVNYLIGMGLFEIEILDTATKDYYYLEVDLTDNYSLYYIKDLTDIHRKNKEKEN